MRIVHLKWLGPWVLLCSLYFVASVWADPPTQSPPLKLLTTIRPIALLVQDLLVTQPQIQVQTLLPLGADPHLWALKPKDRIILDAADWVIWLGPSFEHFLTKLIGLKKTGQVMEIGHLSQLTWPDLTDGTHLHHHGPATPDNSQQDLHLWLNPLNALVIQQALSLQLTEHHPELQGPLQSALQLQKERIVARSDYWRERLEPFKKQGFIVYHDAYRHWVQYFQLNQLAAVNQFSEQGLSVKKMQGLTQLKDQARCVLVESNTLAEQQLAKQLNLKIVVVDGLGYNPHIHSYIDYLDTVAQAFLTCLSDTSM